MTAAALDIRYHRATRESRRLAEVFFMSNPERRHWVRSSMAHEMAGWTDTSHLSAPVMIVQLTATGDIRKTAIAGHLDTLPDDERFLSLLMSHIETQPSDKPTLPREIHAALLELAGYEVRRG